MSYASTMFTLSNINCGLASAVSFMQDRQAGVPPQYATGRLLNNVSNGLWRNSVAYDMQMHGNPVGNNINMFAGYGNPVSNAFGTLGIMSACTPAMFFGCCSTPMFRPMPGPIAFGHFGPGFGCGCFSC